METDKKTYVGHEEVGGGLRNTMGQPDEPGTSAFSSSEVRHRSGLLIYGDRDPNADRSLVLLLDIDGVVNSC